METARGRRASQTRLGNEAQMAAEARISPPRSRVRTTRDALSRPRTRGPGAGRAARLLRGARESSHPRIAARRCPGGVRGGPRPPRSARRLRRPQAGRSRLPGAGDGRDPVEVSGRTVILVDDGLATGSTMRAAAAAVRSQGAERLVVAIPVGAEQTCNKIRAEVDEVVCVLTPAPFRAVGLWYEDFSPVTEDEIRDLLARAPSEAAPLGR